MEVKIENGKLIISLIC